MKKSTKLLSIFLAVLMILSSLTVGAFAAKTKYSTVANLTSLNAYSPYGTVTRLTTEVRLGMLLDWLNNFLVEKNIKVNNGETVGAAGINLLLDFSSVDKVLDSLDSIDDATGAFLWAIGKGLMGDLQYITTSSWQTGMSLNGTAAATIIYELLEFLNSNTNLINHLWDGISMGIISNFVTFDLSSIDKILTNFPGLFYKLLYPLFSRPDDTAAATTTLKNKRDGAGSGSDLVTTLNSFVKGIFTKPMNWTSYRVDAAGNDLGYTTTLPTTAQGTARYFTVSGDQITQMDFNFDTGAWDTTVTYTKEEEFVGSDTYVFRAPDGYEGDANLKWYTAGDDGYFLPSVRDAMNANTFTVDVNGSDSVLGLLYKFAPYLFREMAVIVLNGSVKKLVAELFGVKFTKIGDRDADLNVIKDKDGNTVTGLPNDSFFTSDQEFYLWEYSNYKVIDGVPYYRYQEEYFKGELPLDLSSYYWMFDWNYTITDDWADEFIPASDGATSAAGYTRILPALNDFVGKAINTFILPTWEAKGVTYQRSNIFAWTAGGVDKLAQNILNVARKVFMIAPEEIIDDYYMEAQFYDVMMNGTLKQAVNGLICEVVKLLMPQMTWPDNVVNQDMLSIAAMVVRELITDLMPSYNYDALIYADYNNRTLLEGKSKEYWTNVTLTMGVDLGMYYLRNLADLGEDTAQSYFKQMQSQGALPTDNAETQTYSADFDVSKWTYKVDWVADWALGTELWQWKMSKLVNAGTVNITTYQDPWAKINTVLLKILPLNQLLNDSGVSTTSGTFLENILRGKLVNAISDLDFATFISAFDVPSGYFRNTKILDQAVKLVVYILNGVTNKVMGGTDLLASGTYTTVTALFSHSNLTGTINTLVGKLTTLYNNGLLDPVMSLVNIFLGWKTDPQEYADPILQLSNSAAGSYFLTSGTETLKVINNSAGMLLKHRNSSIVDTAYSIKVVSITSNDGTITCNPNNKVLQPWEDATFTLANSSNTERAVQITVGYEFTGKDGAVLGGTQYKTITTFVSPTAQSSNVVAKSSEYKYSYIFTTYVDFYRNEYETIQFVNTVDAIEAFSIPFSSEVDRAQWVISATRNTAPASPLAYKSFTAGTTSSFVHGSSANANMKTADHGYMEAKGSQMNISPLVVNDADALVPGSAYSGGVFSVSVGNDGRGTNSRKGVDNLNSGTFYWYDIKDLSDLYNSVQGIGKTNLSGDYTAAYNTFLAALKDAAQLVIGPKTTGTFSARYTASNVQAKLDALQAAYDALVDGDYFVKEDYTTQRAMLQTALDACEDRANGEDYDFADHQLFEYFQYEKQRTSTREMIKSMTEPEAPKKYIEGDGASAEQIDAIVAAKSGKELVGINYTIVNPTQDQLDQYAADLAAWRPASYDELNVKNQAALLPYYKQFMTANPRDVSASYQDQFLNKEIAYAQAQNYDSSIYTADTWAAYQDALANAQAVAAANSLPSEIFDAKYELMMAQHDLLKIARSMKEDGQNYLDNELTGLIANAEVILNNSQYYDVVAGMTEDEAYGTLVRALGVRYTDLNGNAAVLYDHPAYSFVDYDRVDSTKNRTKVDACADKLEAAINNFVCNVVIESTNASVISDVETDVKLIMGVLPGAISSLQGLLSYVTGSVNEAVLTPAASAAGLFGTGATVTLSIPAIGDLAIYKVIIFGDVDGDGAIDAYDMFNVDKAQFCGLVLDGAYKTAADISADDTINLADYTAIKNDVAGVTAIDQNPND